MLNKQEIINIAEGDAINYYKELGIDISTREKRLMLNPFQQQELIEWLLLRAIKLQNE